MKRLTAFLLISTISLIAIQAQDIYTYNDDMYSDIEKYRQEEVKVEYNERFKKESDKKDFKRLREFKKEKEDLLDALRYNLGTIYDRSEQLKSLEERIIALNSIIEGKKPNEKVNVPIENIIDYDYDPLYYYKPPKYYAQADTVLTTKEIKDLIHKLDTIKSKILADNQIRSNLIINIRNVRQDIYDCLRQIDSALAPEYSQQDFRKTISIYFTGLIGLLLVVFFFLVYKKSNHNLSKELLSGYGLQFVTLFVLIIAVILFGILGILEGSELAAILSGISGYILGKGVPNTLDTNGELAVQTSTNQ